MTLEQAKETIELQREMIAQERRLHESVYLAWQHSLRSYADLNSSYKIAANRIKDLEDQLVQVAA